MYPKNRSSALLALLAAGGLYAWRNRDKIQSWLNNNAPSFDDSAAGHPAIGETRRIGADESAPARSSSDPSLETGM